MKKKSILILIILCLILIPVNTSAAIEFCSKTAGIWKIIGKILFIVKIMIPILLIIFGVIDLSNAVISNKDGEITTSLKRFMIRVIAGIVVFFVPTIVSIAMNLVSSFANSDAKKDYETCVRCLVDPGNC